MCRNFSDHICVFLSVLDAPGGGGRFCDLLFTEFATKSHPLLKRWASYISTFTFDWFWIELFDIFQKMHIYSFRDSALVPQVPGYL